MSSKPKSSKSSQAAGSSSPAGENEPTLVSLYDIDDFSAHHCGYCNQNGNISIGMSCDSMRIDDYQTLIDRGWRRSGVYIYKPAMDKTCCPLYTIRCDSLNIELRKSQKNTLKTMRRYLEKNEQKKRSNPSVLDMSKSEKQEDQSKNLIHLKPIVRDDPNRITHAQKVFQFFLDEQRSKNIDEMKNQPVEKILDDGKIKSKQRRLFKKLLRLKQKNLISSQDDIEKCLKRKPNRSQPSPLESNLRVNNPINKLEIRLVRSWPPSKEFEDSLAEEHKLYTKYQTVIHRDSPLECGMNQFKRFLCTSPLMKASYSGALTNLQLIARSSDVIDTSLMGNIAAIGYGSFHQQYRINGKLIGVGVIDILNNCVSSVYFFYDPEFQFLNMGTYSALREIEFTRQLNKLDPNIRWYYLGFYAHTCRKMRYKGFFHPSYLLCPETFTWHAIEKCVPLLDKNKYQRFGALDEIDSDRNERVDDVKIRIKLRDRSDIQVFGFREFCEILNPSFVPQFTHLITGYCQLFGNKFSRRVLIKF